MKKAIVLGGTRPHITLIQKLKQRGYYVILLDYLEAPIAAKYADTHVKESTLYKERVLQVAQAEKADLVISTCIDQANVTSAYVSEKMGLSCPYSYETALNVTDKTRMKKILFEHGIPTSRYVIFNHLDDIAHLNLNYPLIVKPADSNSSKGISMVASPQADLLKIIEEARLFSRNKRVIIEEFVEGKEIGIDCFVINGKAQVLMIKERRKICKNNDGSQQILGCIWPMPLKEDIKEQAEVIANSIAKAFGLENSALMIQAIIRDDKIYVIEFGARIGGGESYKIIKECVGFDYVEASINTFTNEPVKETLQKPNFFYADNFIYAQECVFDHINFAKFLFDNGTIEHAYELKNRGSEIGSSLSSNNRVGTFVVKSETIDGLYAKINLVLANMEVYDIQGNPVMRKDIY